MVIIVYSIVSDHGGNRSEHRCTASRITIKNAKKKIEFKSSCAGLRPAAVDTKASAGNPACAVGCKEKDQLGDIFR